LFSLLNIFVHLADVATTSLQYSATASAIA